MRIIKILFTLLILTSFPFASNTKVSETPSPVRYSAPEIVGITISPGDDIQKAVDSVPDGGTLTLNEGSYDTVDSIVLEGRNDVTIEGTGEVWINTMGIDHHVLSLIDCKGITIKNIKAQHIIPEGGHEPVQNPADGAVLGIIGGGNDLISGCELVGCGIYGVYAESADNIVLQGCYLHDNSKSALFFKAGAKVMHVTIKDCSITRNADSVQTEGDVVISREGGNTIERNTPFDYMDKPDKN